MNAFFNTVRNIAVLFFASIVITYIVVLLQVNDILPHSELSNNVIDEVVSSMSLQAKLRDQ
jgi:hypothetical protein